MCVCASEFFLTFQCIVLYQRCPFVEAPFSQPSFPQNKLLNYPLFWRKDQTFDVDVTEKFQQFAREIVHFLGWTLGI